MKRKILVLIVLNIISFNFSLGQSNIKFKPGVKLIENYYKDEFKDPKSVLFSFDIVGCQANYYTNLAKSLKKYFKKTNTKVEFNFNIKTNIETEQIPRKKYLKSNFELICFVSTSNMKSWDKELIKRRKQNYDLDLIFEKAETKENVGKLKLNINSYYTIATQNKNSSKLICKLITR